ncbi:unnamed protein product [Lasius platythorax]|uniref:Uncharacterized protein n=1 Tax=Lasius platythorax TaxID=488582 RepID=A0AAV2NN84_9HYME
MKRIARSSFPSLFCLRMCFLLYVLVINSTLNSAEINKRDGSNMTYTKTKSDSIKNTKVSTISSQQCGNNKIDIRNRTANESARISDKKSSAALNRFLEDTLKAQNDLKWIDHATHRVNHITQLDDSLAYTNWHSTVSVNTEDVLEPTDIDYRSRLRGKRGFDQNYERMWMLQKKKYGEESTRDVPQRIYLDNDMTFKREADDADFDILYRSPGTLDRGVYEEGAIADQPLKDWTRKKDLHSSGDWSNSNENPKVTNDESTWLRDYNSAREILANSDLNKDEEKLHVDDDTRNQLEIVSLNDPMRADDFSVLQKSPSIRNRKSQNTSLTLESLKKIVLDLRNSLTLSNKRENVLSRESSSWNHPRSAAEKFDFERDLDEHRNSKELHDRAKRSRRSFIANLNNQMNVSENKSHPEAQIIKDALGNVTKMHKSKGVVRLYSGYLNNDGRSLKRTLNKMNISDSQSSLDKGSFLNHRFINLTITSSVANKANISGLRYLSITEPYLNNYSIDNTSFFLVKIDLQTHLPEHTAVNKVPRTNSTKLGRRFPIEKIPKNIDYTAEDHTVLLDSEKDFAVSDTSADSMHFLTNSDANDSRKFAGNRKSDEEKLSARKKSRLDTDDGQSKGAGEEFPEGNTSRGFDTTANESRRIHAVETIAAAKREKIETDGMQKENRELIPDVIKVFEPRERPYQKQEAEARLLGRMREDETFAEQTRTNGADESTDANAREDFSSSIDLVIDATVRLGTASVNASEIGESIISKDRRKDLASMTVGKDLQKQQQMVPPLSATNSSANKSNGNSDRTDRIDIRVVGSNGNETMNVNEGTQTVTGYHESDNHLRRRLLWIPTVSVDTETDDSLIKSTGSVLNSAIESHIENVIDEDRQQSKIINSADSRKVLIRVKRDDNAEESPALQNNFNPQMSDANHARYKRSTYSFENLESNNAAENVDVAKKEVAVNHDEKQENNEEYENIERVKGDYNDSEEDVMEDNDRAMEESERGGRALSRIDPVKAKVNMLIKQKLEKKNKNKDSDYRRKRRSMLDMIEYYDYDDNNEEQERDASINEQGIRNKNDEFSIKDFDERSEIKRDDKTPYKPGDLGKKKNENAEAMMKEKRKKAKNKEPKEQIVVDLGERKNKTSKNSQKDKKLSGTSESTLGHAFSKGKRLSTKENLGKIRQSEGFTNNVYREKSTNLKSKWLDQSFENRMALPKNSELTLNDNNRKKNSLNEPLDIISNARVNVNPDVIENILDIEPIKILKQNRELEAWKDFYEDFENERPEDRYYYEGNDRRHPNNVESLYEELKNVYDWTDGELKSGPRLRGDQRLRYESDNKLDTNPAQLQPMNDRFFGSSQNDNEQRRFPSTDASWTIAGSSSTATSNYLAFKVTGDIFKGGLERNKSTKENSRNIFSVSTTTESEVSKIVEDGNNPFPERSAMGRSEINTNSGSLYENRKYIESEMRKVLKRNLNSENQAAISSQDLRESFVESLDWQDDFDDNVKVRFGRGLKAVDEAMISDLNETHDLDNKSDMANATNINSEFYNSSQIFHDNSSISHNWYNNISADLINIFNVHHGASERSAKKIQEPILMNTINIVDGNEDLEAAEQKYVNNNQTTRIRRAAASYRTFYDDVSGNEGDSDEADKSLSDHFQLSNILEDQSDSVYDGNAATNWNNDIHRHSQIPRINSRKKEKSGKKITNKQSSDKHAKKNISHSSSNRNRRHHTHRSDVSRNTNRADLKPKKKSKAEASSLTELTGIQKSKTAEESLLRAGVNEEVPSEKVLYENAEDQSTVKPEKSDARRKEITLLLAADNVDDESQMDVALHGELAGKIVEQIFEQVQKNDQLKSVFGPGLQRNYKTKDVVAASNIYRQGLDEDGTNHTETMMKRIMELLGGLILNEVQRKTCVSLSPDMRKFLGWMLEVDREDELFEEVPSLPLIHEEIISEQDWKRKFLFDNTSEREDISELQKKVKVLNTLVKEYNALTAKEKTKVQTVHDYLIRQLNLLLKYIEEREKKGKLASISIGAAKAGTGNILQYQSAMPNVTNTSYSMTKDAFFSPINAHKFLRFNNAPKVTDRQHHDDRTQRRETRSLEIPSKQHRKTKRQKFRNHKKDENYRKAKGKHRKHCKHQNRPGSSPGYMKSRQKRASHEERDSLYLGYEEPTIYDSFDLLDAKLTGKKKKRKRELADKKNMTTENDRMLDLLPIKGKNRLEDEVILLNKREAWKKENEEQLEEVAFGKDMRNGTRREKERFEKLTVGDKHKPIDETSSRTKREDIIRGTSTVRSIDRLDKFHSVSEANSDESENILRASYDNDDNGAKDVDKLRLAERRINVFADNKTDAAIDTATAEVSTREKLVINAEANNQVKGKLCAINRETKIDRANGSTSFANLTSDIGVSKERRKVSAAEKEADDNAVKLNRATNYRSEEMDPEIELKNLRQGREKGIYGVKDWRMIDLFYDDDDDNLSRNKLRAKYVSKLYVPGDLDPENNLELPRLRSNKWSGDVIEWKLLPVIKSSPHYDDHVLSRIRLTEKETPVSNNIRNFEIKPNAYLNTDKFLRSKHRRRRNGVFNISPELRIIDDNSFSRRIRSKTQRASEIAESKNLRVKPKIFLKAQRLPRPRNNKRSNGVAEFGAPFELKNNRKLREILRSRNDPEFDDRLIYNEVGRRSPIWPHRYYDDYVDSPTFHFVPNVLRRDGDAYRYPAGAYLEYGPFKERTRDSNRRVAGRNRYRLKTSGEVIDFPADNLASKTSKSSLVREKFLEPAIASRKDYFVFGKTKCTPRTREGNETKSKE